MHHPAHTSVLGQATAFPTQYDPALLFAIERAETRPSLPTFQLGYDVWHAYELSWLNNKGKPQVAIARFVFDAFSPRLVESKSFKLYLGSFNMHRVASTSELITTLKHDLSAASGAAVGVTLLGTHELGISSLPSAAICLDDFDLPAEDTPDQDRFKLLQTATSSVGAVIQAHQTWLYSDLLRSVCPVTGQPDWATLLIRISAANIDLNALLAYIVSFRNHSGFHEQCIETIFNDLFHHLKPTDLLVYGAYTRRGGLDINPCRSSSKPWLTPPIRLSRQ